MTTTAPRAGILVAARLASSRLPGKALLEIQGQPILGHLLTRLKRARLPQTIVVCTTQEPDDDAIVDLASRSGMACVRGSTSDVLARYLLAAQTHDLDLLVTADGDDVFCDPPTIDRIILRQQETGADFVSCEGLPYGTFPYALTRPALERVCATKAEENTEGWGRFFRDARHYRTTTVTVDDPALYRPQYRLTLDYPEDYLLLQAIFKRLAPDGRYFGLHELFALLDAHPELASINESQREVYEQHFQKYRGPAQFGGETPPSDSTAKESL